jgi:hypothetical protein
MDPSIAATISIANTVIVHYENGANHTYRVAVSPGLDVSQKITAICVALSHSPTIGDFRPDLARRHLALRSLANPAVGCSRIHGELLKFGIEFGQTSVAKYMARMRTPIARVDDVPSQPRRWARLNGSLRRSDTLVSTVLSRCQIQHATNRLELRPKVGDGMKGKAAYRGGVELRFDLLKLLRNGL